jgi:hypothetical protein
MSPDVELNWILTTTIKTKCYFTIYEGMKLHLTPHSLAFHTLLPANLWNNIQHRNNSTHKTVMVWYKTSLIKCPWRCTLTDRFLFKLSRCL